jgi:hypothetical protein
MFVSTLVFFNIPPQNKFLNIMVENFKVYGLTNISVEVSSILTYTFRLLIDLTLKCIEVRDIYKLTIYVCYAFYIRIFFC